MTKVQRQAALALVGKRVRFAHQADAPENYHLVTIARNGMVELAGWSGEFHPAGFIPEATRVPEVASGTS